MIIFSLPEGYTLESTPESSAKLQIQRADDQKVAGKVEGGGDGVIGAEATAIVADQLDNITQQQECRTGEA